MIETTAEHPVFVIGRGWRCAAELERGDTLASHNAVLGVVESVVESEQIVSVYNLRVADWHTYFVGGDEWGFSVWAHNAECAVIVARADGKFVLQGKVTGKELKVGTEAELLAYAKQNEHAIALGNHANIEVTNIQKMFDKHGADFGMSGNWNPGRAVDMRNVILNHLDSPNVQQIAGTYRGQTVTHVVDPNTGLNVILDETGFVIGGWQLGAAQLNSVLTTGRLF